MANYRQIHVSIWKDPWVLELTPDEKLLFIYLFSNENASLSGIYEIALRVICFETGLENSFVLQALEKFSIDQKIYYDNSLSIVWVRNLRKYNSSPSPKIATRIQTDLDAIPECELKEAYIAYFEKGIPYQYPIDRASYEMKCNEMKFTKGSDGAEPEQKPPVNLQEWLDTIRIAKNKSSALRFMFQVLYPDATEVPSYQYIGRVAKNVGGAGRLAQLLWECSSKNVTGDVMRYIQGYNKNHEPKESAKVNKTDPKKTLEQLEKLQEKK